MKIKIVQYRTERWWKMLCAVVFMATISTTQTVWANGGVFFDDMDQAFKEQKVSYFGTVRDKKGKGLADVKVLVTVAREKVETYTVQSDSRGKYKTPTYSGVDTRRIQLFAEKPGYKFSEVVQVRGPKKVGDATEADIIMAPIQ